MTSSTTTAYDDADVFSGVFRSPDCYFTLESPGRFQASATLLDLHRIHVARLSENLPRVGYFEIPRSHVAVSFQGDPGPAIHLCGVELGSAQVGLHAPGARVIQRLTGPTTWCTVSLPAEKLREISIFESGRDFTPCRDTLTATASPAALARLREVHADAAALTKAAPAIVADAEASRGLEQALTEALLACLAGPERSEASLARHRHLAVLRKLREVVEKHEGESLWVLQLCAEMRISGRRLQEICNEYLGMAPKRYLLLRRMDLVHRALHQSDPSATNVTEIATRYGFWELGRFAVAYRTLYGEPPSSALRRPARPKPA